MSTKREQVLAALHQRLQTISLAGVKRDADKPTEVGSAGLIILRDGIAEQLDVSLSPLTYHWRHVADVEVYAAGVDRKAIVDGLFEAIQAAIAAQPTLGGLVHQVLAEEAPAVSDDPGEGRATIRQALVQLSLYYDSSSPLG